MTYLQAVVRGDEVADPLRITAARAVLPFEQPKLRTPMKGPTPSQRRQQAAHAEEDALRREWNLKAEAIRAKARRK